MAVLREWWSAALALAGWAALSAGAAALTSPLAWLFSAGLLCLLLVGLRPIATVIVHGIEGVSARTRGPHA